MSCHSELRHVISNLGEAVDEDEVEEMMKEADKDSAFSHMHTPARTIARHRPPRHCDIRTAFRETLVDGRR